MIILIIILVVAAAGGVAAYLVMQYTGVLGTVPAEPRLRGFRGEGRMAMPRSLDEIPQGCLVTTLVFMAVWILAWLVVLIVGLRLLLA